MDWGEIKVPKYDKITMWALTKKEQVEILGKSWPLEFRKQVILWKIIISNWIIDVKKQQKR